MKVPVFYMPQMVADGQSYSPSASKPAKVISEWILLNMPIDVRVFEPATREDFYKAHKKSYVDGVLNGEVINGFGNKIMAVANSLPYTTGSMMAAAHCALENGWGAVSPTSGFHHAHFDFGSGFCTFNGLMVTAIDLIDAYAHPLTVGILDLDQHWGDGTEDIICTLWANVRQFHPSRVEFMQAPKFLSVLGEIISSTFDDCDIVLYQAGADPHVNDPLGGWMTTEELLLRDRIVFETLLDLKIPVAWNLAGGYQRDDNGGIQPVLDIHNNTMKAFVETHGAGDDQISS